MGQREEEVWWRWAEWAPRSRWCQHLLRSSPGPRRSTVLPAAAALLRSNRTPPLAAAARVEGEVGRRAEEAAAEEGAGKEEEAVAEGVVKGEEAGRPEVEAAREVGADGPVCQGEAREKGEGAERRKGEGAGTREEEVEGNEEVGQVSLLHQHQAEEGWLVLLLAVEE